MGIPSFHDFCSRRCIVCLVGIVTRLYPNKKSSAVNVADQFVIKTDRIAEGIRYQHIASNLRQWSGRRNRVHSHSSLAHPFRLYSPKRYLPPSSPQTRSYQHRPPPTNQSLSAPPLISSSPAPAVDLVRAAAPEQRVISIVAAQTVVRAISRDHVVVTGPVDFLDIRVAVPPPQPPEPKPRVPGSHSHRSPRQCSSPDLCLLRPSNASAPAPPTM